MSLYPDASVLVPLLVQEAATPSVEALLFPAESEMVISDLAAAEVSSAISRRVRMGEFDGDEGMSLLRRFDSWRAGSASFMALHAGDLAEATALVRHFDLMLRTPDALHLVMARRCGASLVTLDRLLARAAETLTLPCHVPA